MKKYQYTYCLFVIVLLFHSSCKGMYPQQKPAPKLILSQTSTGKMLEAMQTNELLNKSYKLITNSADIALAAGIEVPIPVNSGGGYTHEKHKRNYTAMYNAATVFAITGEAKYADFVKNMLLKYAELYPTLPLHPKHKENHPAGKLFWQGLNEAVWLFYSIQAYDLVKSAIATSEQQKIENDLFRNVAKFISVDSYETFNKIHNHGTWAVASVGMTGYVLGDKDLADRALLGSEKKGNTGFLKQLDELFSPDGYYSEGPYYQRYAILPFIVFAEAIEINQPELKIFEYRNKVLHKAVTTLLQLTNENGYFYPYNDAIKAKNYNSDELIFAVNIAFERYKDAELLPIVNAHGKVSLTNAGLQTAIAMENWKTKTYYRKSAFIADGKNGDQGGLALIRKPYANKNSILDIVFKFASQGMGHGHFDRLSFMYYDEGREVLQDYGAVRFHNIEAKGGGGYLKENNAFAKQSIAHNTIIVDQTSQYHANVKEGSAGNPELLYANFDNPDFQLAAATDKYAYQDVVLTRIMGVIELEKEQPMILDVCYLQSDNEHQYDLNYSYLGDFITTNFPYTKKELPKVLGTNYGYEYLYETASGTSTQPTAAFTFLNNDRFYTITTVNTSDIQLLFTEIGANDPKFNLRNDAGYIIRKNKQKNTVFASIIEPHGFVNTVNETVSNPNSAIEKLDILSDTSTAIAVSIKLKNSPEYYVLLAKTGNSENSISINGKKYSWQGSYRLIKP